MIAALIAGCMTGFSSFEGETIEFERRSKSRLSVAGTNMIELHNKTLKKGHNAGIHCTIRIFSHKDTHKSGYKTEESCQVFQVQVYVTRRVFIQHTNYPFCLLIQPEAPFFSLRPSFLHPNSKSMEINFILAHRMRGGGCGEFGIRLKAICFTLTDSPPDPRIKRTLSSGIA